MTPASRTPKRRKTRRRTAGPGRMAWLLGLALLVVVCGVGGLKWSRSQGGRAALLGLGADRMHADVQESVEQALGPVLPGLATGAARSAGDLDRTLPDGAVIRCRLVAVDDSLPWWQVQEAVVAALAPVGADVLWGERLVPPGRARGGRGPDETRDLLRLDLGVHGHPTHTLVLHRASQEPDLAWDGDGVPAAWERLTAEAAPTVALIIDDWGYGRNKTTGRLLALDAPLTMAVLPGQSYSRHFALKGTDLILPAAAPGDAGSADAAELRRDAGCPVDVNFADRGDAPNRRREIMLHLPMQPQSWPETDPGPRAVMVGMDGSAVTDRLTEALQGLPGVRGVNNHMGSAATGDEATMKIFMKVLRDRDLYFVDSLTSARSVAYETALAAGIPAARNRIFLDYNSEDPERIRANLEVLVRSARERGFAVGIGHPHAATASVLEQELPRLQAQGVRFVTVSEMLALQRAAGGET